MLCASLLTKILIQFQNRRIAMQTESDEDKNVQALRFSIIAGAIAYRQSSGAAALDSLSRLSKR